MGLCLYIYLLIYPKLQSSVLPYLFQVRISDETGKLAEQFKIDVVPSLVLFQNRRPYMFKGDVADEKSAIEWLKGKLEDARTYR